jgi:hypothetical protein
VRHRGGQLFERGYGKRPPIAGPEQLAEGIRKEQLRQAIPTYVTRADNTQAPFQFLQFAFQRFRLRVLAC